jgi:hypothetical protein
VFSFRKSKNWDKAFSEKIAKRVAKIPTLDLNGWAEQAIYETGRLLSAHERDRTPESLKDLMDGAEAVHALVHEISKRTNRTL